MAEERDASLPSAAMAAAGPPGIDRVLTVLRRAGSWYLGLGLVVLASGLALAGFGLIAEAGRDAGEVIAKGGGLIAAGSIFPFLEARARARRIALLARLRERWIQLARAGDPDDQIASLRRIYSGLLSGSLRSMAVGEP